MNLGLENKTAIVTGGASNIGRGITLAFAKEGSNVVIADMDEKQSNKVIQQAKGLGGHAIFIKTDVTEWDSVHNMVKRTLEEFNAIHVLVNNVGGQKLSPFAEKPREEWDNEIKLNYLSAANCMRIVLPLMIEQKYGKIVNIASDAARAPEHSSAFYAGCKAAVVGLSRTVALEVGRYGINVNVVCPSLTFPENPEEEVGELSGHSDSAVKEWYKPEKIQKIVKSYPLGRLGRPQDIANAVVFLSSDAAEFITGQTLSVNGGYLMI